MRSVLILYAPVLHKGYLDLLFKYQMSVDQVYLLDDELIDEFKETARREIREVRPEDMRIALNALGVAPGSIQLLNKHTAQRLSMNPEIHVIMPRLGICERFAEKYPPQAKITWDTVFLQWDAKSVVAEYPASPDIVITEDEFLSSIMTEVEEVARRSSDWWRHVAAAVIQNGKILYAVPNHHPPGEQTQYIQGDPRDFIEAGTRSEISTARHAEQTLIGFMARIGTSLEGADLWVNVFPCPVCAKLIAISGIKRLFFRSGHASLDGLSVLQDAGIQLVLVK